MASILEKVAKAAHDRQQADQRFRDLLVQARQIHSWGELANAARMSRAGIRHLVNGKPKGDNQHGTD